MLHLSWTLWTLLLGSAWAGWSFAPMPIGDYSTDHGVGYGGVVLANWSPVEDEPPKLSTGVQLMWSTGTFRDHWLKADWRIDERWRMEGVAGRRAWNFTPYYGEGNARLEAEASEHRYHYEIDGARVLLNLRRRLRGDFEVFTTGFLRTARIGTYEGSLLAEEALEGGLDEGLYTSLALGLLYDSRDRLPSPGRGHLAELSVRGSHPWIGSDWTGGGVNLTERVYLSLAEPLVWASRVTLDVRWGETPFFASHILGGSQWSTLGGPWLLRGFPEGRFRGDAAAVGSTELRWLVHTISIRKHTLGLMPTPFVDAGRVVVWGEDVPPWTVRGDVGLGARFVWDEEMVLRIDTAVGLETGAREPSLGVWFMFDQPF